MDNTRKYHLLEQIEAADESIDLCTNEKRKLLILIENTLKSYFDNREKTNNNYEFLISQYQRLIEEYKKELEFEVENNKMCIQVIKEKIKLR